MRKSKFFMVGMLAMVLIFGITVVGCATSRHSVEINNVRNISEIYIRNAGTTNWGNNIVKDLQNIDKSRFSEMVDIRVLDTNGVVYSNYNVPFDDAAFVETNKTSSLNPYASGALGIALIVILLVVAL
jgi:hypothetical protein